MLINRLLYRIPPVRLLDLAGRIWPDDAYLLFDGQRLTRRQVFRQVHALAAGLQALGLRPGERVATLLPVCPEAVYTIFLPWWLGNVYVPLNPFLREHELRRILADCGAAVVITTQNWFGQDYPALLERLLPDLPDLRHVIVCGAETGAGERFRPYREAVRPDAAFRRIKVAADDLVMLSYTSGTTGQPKGVMHTAQRFWGLLVRAAGAHLAQASFRCMLLPFPPYQFGGMLGLIASLLAGGRVILMERFDPAQMLELIQAERVTQIAAAPTMYRLLLRTPGQERYDLSSVQRVIFSAEACPFDLAQALHERLGCNLENIYSTTESMFIAWTGLDDPWEVAAATVGRPVPGADVRIVDDARQPLPPGARGEIAVRTSQMMTGYYRDPALTSQVLDAQGWFYTGDIGYVGEDGCLRLTDRKKDLIIRGGQNIYPAEVEACLHDHPAIRRSAVLGVPDVAGGEAIWAYVERQPGATLTTGEALAFCRERIAPFKVPEIVRFVDSLPTTATGKVEKYKLREVALAESTPK